jgi:hypothetical protein
LQCRARRALRVRFLETVVGVFLQAAELAFELLIAELQLLHHARELLDLGFETVEAQHEVGVGHLRRAVGRRRALAAATEALAAAEDAVEQSGRAFGLLGARGRGDWACRRDRQQGEQGCRRHTRREACHGRLIVVETPEYHTNPCVQIVTASRPTFKSAALIFR